MTFLSDGREWGVGSVVVGSAFGAPQIFENSIRNPSKQGFWGLWTEHRGAPKTQFQRTRIQRPILGPLILGELIAAM